MRKTSIVVAFILLITSSLVGCNKEATFTLGILDEGSYSNRYFGFTIDIDEDYYFLTQEEILTIRNSAVDETENFSTEEIILSEQPVVYYVYALKEPLDSTRIDNPYIAVYSERLDYIDSSIKTKEEYIQYNMDFAVAIFNASGFKATSSNIDKLWYDDRQFANAILTVNLEDLTMNKELFTIIRGDYAITVILGYSNSNDREEMLAFLDSITIAKQ